MSYSSFPLSSGYSVIPNLIWRFIFTPLMISYSCLICSYQSSKHYLSDLCFRLKQWRRRYFVLSTPQTKSLSSSSDDPPLAYLHYYDNEKNPKKSRKKGCIDLTNCEEILAQLESVFYEHVFSLRTKDRGKTRTYYLAADSIEDMNVWISCLCRVLRMNDNDSE